LTAQTLNRKKNNLKDRKRIRLLKDSAFTKSMSVKQAGEALRENEKRLQALMDASPVGISWADMEGNIKYNNRKFRQLFGYTVDDIPTIAEWRRRAYPDPAYRETVPSLVAMLTEAQKQGREVRPIEVTITCKDGSTRCVEEMGAFASNQILAIFNDLTEHKQAEEALRRSEERYRTIIENIQDGYSENDLAGNFTFVNDVICRNLGYTKEELIGMNYRQYADEENAKKVFQAFNKLYETGEPCRVFDYEITKKDGTKGTYEISVSLIRDSEGKPVGFRGVSRDITERKRAEEALRQSEERYRTILENIQEGYSEIDLRGNFTFVNNVTCRHLGYTKQELSGMDYRRYTSEENVKKIKKIYSEVYKTGRPIDLTDHELISKDGTIRTYELSVSLIKNPEGKPIGFRSISRDITERKQAEEALRRSEEKYRTILENIEEAYFEDDVAGNFTFVNDVLCRLLGYTREELIGMNYRKYTDENNAKQLHELYNDLYKTGKPINAFDLKAIRKDGSTAIYETSVFLLRDSEGKPIGFRGVSRDVTERKKMEAALREREERYRTLLETMEEGYYEVDLAGNFTSVNDSFCEMYASPREKLLGMNYRENMDEETARRVYKLFNQVYDTGEPLKLAEWEIMRGDGEKAVLESSVYLIKNAQGERIGFRGIERNITERKRTEERLRQSEERYRTILESIQDAYYESDFAGNYTLVNPAVCRHLGYSKEELIGMNFRQHSDEETRRKLKALHVELYRTGKPIDAVEAEHIRKDGTKGTVEISVSLIRDSEGKPVGFRGVSRDITERKRAEEALRRSEEKYRTILESIEDGYAEFDLHGKITFFNDALPKILGYPADELKNLDYKNRQYMDKEDAEKVSQTFTEVYATGKPTRGFQYGIIRQDGTKRYLEGYISLRKDAGGQPVGFQGLARDITERKKIEEALRRSEERYRTILENMREGYWETDLAGNFTFVNDAECRIAGTPREQLIGTNNLQYTDETTAKKMHEVFSGIYRTGEAVERYEFEFIRINGTKGFAECSASLIRDEQDKPIGFRGVTRNITERKRAGEALRQSEERYRTIIENIQDGYFENDLAGNFTFVNDAECVSLGYTRDELIGMNNRRYTDKETAKKLFQVYNKLYRTGEPVKGLDLEVIRKDGTKAFDELSVSLIRDSEGKPVGFRGVSRDITERKRAEEALRRSEERYRTILEDIQEPYFENDLAGNVTFCNDAMCKSLQYTKEELIGMNYRQYEDEKNARRLRELYNGLYRTGKPIEILDAEVIRKDGTKANYDASVSLVKDSEGKPIGFRGVSRDITERKRAEEEKLSLQEQLRQSQKMEAIGQLAGGVAHDFNNLLTVIKGYSQLSLLDLKKNDPLRGNIQEIEKATQRATDLTRQLLAFSRRQILDFKVLDLNALLKDLEKMLRRIIGEDIELVALLSEDLGRVKIDPSQIEQVIFNLAVNARDAMPSGGKLTIETANAELDEVYAHAHADVIPGHYVRLSVSDTGVGMSQEVKEKVFEPFFTTKEKGKGTGLGLSMVYGIVKQSNGNIWVYSEPGRGTAFKINLPRIEEELDTLRGRDETDFSPGGSETVLLVEDDELVRDLAHRLLKQQGYRVWEAANGEEALRVAREHDGETIHLLLADIVMPQMGGKELADQLKILRPDVKVLYTSGYADDAIVHHGVLDPGTHFLQKPFSLKTLSHKVREVLDG
jgi:two-component system, cell cycle sensor histidine kinase and response regulator CckA